MRVAALCRASGRVSLSVLSRGRNPGKGYFFFKGRPGLPTSRQARSLE